MPNNRRSNPWAREDVIDYVLDSYGGVEETDRGRPKRAFIWADDDGEIWIGNSAAFAEHCSELFGFTLLPYDYIAINRIMIDVGERIVDERSRERSGEKSGQTPLQPDKRRARS